ncbi:MAG: alpha/beta hydrolase [Actinomycetes bacterium]|jgi:pimeloyl-ACP methyl ester carboxylesterase
MTVKHSGVLEHRERRLFYLERLSDSPTVTVFLHGLGLDASDYRDYLERDTEHHQIALTLKGFDPVEERPDRPVSLAEHVEMVSGMLAQIAAGYPTKKLVLVGFSLGADLVLKLAERWAANEAEAVRLEGALLLDPNVNQSTMTISRLFAAADRDNPLPAFKKLINFAPDRETLLELCGYVSKIARKDFAQLWQLSRDMLGYWRPDGYNQIGERLATVAQVARTVRVVLSALYEEHLPAMRNAARRHNAVNVAFVLNKCGHFDLIREDVLKHELSLVR